MLNTTDSATTVERYYEDNTQRFLWFQRKAASKNIHQGLWKEAHYTNTEAFNYSNQLILQEVSGQKEDPSLKVIDLGCGVGSTIFYLLKHYPSANYYGVSISETQISIAQERFNTQKNLQANTHFITADFTKLPATLPPIDIAYSIEAFVHAPAPEQYFAAISQKLKKGGKLILVDDFLNDDFDWKQLDKKGKKALADFKYGWVANSLITSAMLQNIAAKYGLKIIKQIDLTPFMRNNTLKHKWIRFLVFSFRWLYQLSPWKSNYFRSWIGGKGKQYCLKNGMVKYQQIVLEKL